MDQLHNDCFEEILETGGIKRPLFHQTGSFAISPKSTDVTCSVFIDAETERNSYILEFFHLDKEISSPEWVCIDRTENFDNLYDAVRSFSNATSVFQNIILEDKIAKEKKHSVTSVR